MPDINLMWPRGLDIGAAPGTDPLSNRTALAAAIRAYAAGLRTRPPIALIVGDSNTTGEGAGIGGGVSPKLTGAYAWSVSQQLRDVLPQLAGLRTIGSAFIGEGNVTANSVPVGEYDPRITLAPSGWAPDGSANYLGGRLFVATQGQTGFLTFASGAVGADTVEVHFAVPGPTGYGASVGVYASDDTKLGEYNCNGTASVSSVTFTSPKLADGIVKIRNDGTGTANVGAVFVYKAGAPQLIITHGSRSAGTAANFADVSAPHRGMGQLDTIRPDLTIVCLTINDIIAATAAGTYNTALTTVVAKALRFGDVIVATGQPAGSANFLSGNAMRDIEVEARKVAAAHGCMFLNMHQELVSQAVQAAAGNSWDVNHFKAGGYRLTAEAYARAIVAHL